MAVTDIAGGVFFQAELRVCGPVIPKRGDKPSRRLLGSGTQPFFGRIGNEPHNVTYFGCDPRSATRQAAKHKAPETRVVRMNHGFLSWPGSTTIRKICANVIRPNTTPAVMT
jgi:hypothetical protein